MQLTLSQKILSGYLLILIIYWVLLNRSDLQTDFWNYFYSFSFSLIPLIGGLLGMYFSKPWGFTGSALGRAIFYIAAGLFTWGAGSMVWFYYNIVEKISAPYPSLADVGYIITIPLWVVGIINLSKATGAQFALQNMKGRVFLIIVPLIVLFLSYHLLVNIARGGVITEAFDDKFKLFFDLAYPSADVIVLTLALVIFGLSIRYFGGIFKFSVISLLVGFGVMYLADFIFSYTTTVGTFYVGNFGDLIFTLAMFLITFGIFGFSNPDKLKSK